MDALAVYAFSCQVYCKGIVFVPSIPNDAVTEERVQLYWKKQTDDKEEESREDDSWSSGDVRNLVPDTYSCVIKVSVAPKSVPRKRV